MDPTRDGEITLDSMQLCWSVELHVAPIAR